MTDAAIEATDLVRDFKKGPRAVDGIDLRVEPGEVYGFLGPNGAGKSTTVLMLTTLLPPTSGSAGGGLRRGEDGAKVRETIGAALQEARSTRSSPAPSTCAPDRPARHAQGARRASARRADRARGAGRRPPTAAWAATRAA